MKTGWKERPLLSKIVTVCTVVVSAAIIVLAILQLSGVWPYSPYVYMPLMGVNLLLQAYSFWKTDRGVAIFNLCAAGFVLVCSAVIWILR